MKNQSTSNTVFISYAREDARAAERLYMNLRRFEVNAWLDTKCLLPGDNWSIVIENTIRNSAFFIALISRHSLTKRGYVQKELKYGLEKLREYRYSVPLALPR